LILHNTNLITLFPHKTYSPKEKEVERLRMITEAKLSHLRDHTRLLDQAFNELKEVNEGEFDLIYDKIKELDQRMDLNGLSKNR
jgi:hypothetical protein